MATTLITLADLKVEIGISTGTTDQDTLLQALLDACVSLWEELSGREWTEVEYTEYHNNDRDSHLVALRRYPVKSVKTVHEDPVWVFGSDTLLTADVDYRVDLPNGLIYSSAKFCSGKQSVKVIYTAGYTAATIPAHVKEIIIRQAAHWHQQATLKRWAMSSISSKEGTTISVSLLKDNMLPEFVRFATG